MASMAPIPKSDMNTPAASVVIQAHRSELLSPREPYIISHPTKITAAPVAAYMYRNVSLSEAESWSDIVEKITGVAAT